jgi:CheY-like chemotaxis protein
MKILIVDDERDIQTAIQIAHSRSYPFRLTFQKDAEIILVRSFKNAKEIFLAATENEFDFLLLDHDLGSLDVYNDGTRLMSILEERFVVEDVKPFSSIIPISSNPIGVERIWNVARKFDVF